MGKRPERESIVNRFETVAGRARPLQAVVCRFADPTFATRRDLLRGEGARRFGGRWNAKGSFATVYASFSDETALAESKANHLYYGWDPADALPKTMVAVDVRLQRVLNLTDGAVRQALQVSSRRMRADDWRKANRRGEHSLTQLIGQLAYHAGLEGLIVPACDGGRNRVWFPAKLSRGGLIRIRNLSRLRAT